MADLIAGLPLSTTFVLVDTNVIIEAVRTGTWNALTGALRIQTVEECRAEARRGEATRPGYVPVSELDLARLDTVHSVSMHDRAEYLISDPEAVAMDPGERDLFAHVHQLLKAGDGMWVICSSDKASIRAAVRIAIADQVRSLEALCNAVGTRARVPLKPHHEERFLRRYRTEYLLGG